MRMMQIRELKDYVLFDLETTGLSPDTDAIIEISALKVIGGEVVDEFSTLVNPCMHIPYMASSVNGITDRRGIEGVYCIYRRQHSCRS